MGRCCCALAALWSCFLQLAHCDDEAKLTKDRMPYYLDPRFENEFEFDDNKQALLKTRNKIHAGLNKTYGVLMVATHHDAHFSAHSIPIWKAYCEKHGYDFFLQEESLVEGGRPHWTKPRVVMELVSQAKWKYVWMVDPQSLPVAFDKGWQILIKEHLRKVRWTDDSQKDRQWWCPEDCPKNYNGKHSEEACYGPQLSGCIFWLGKPAWILPSLLLWYEKRKDLKDESTGLKLAMKSTRAGPLFEQIFFSPVQNQMGFPDSTFLATHQSIDELLATIRKNKVLGEILNNHGEYKPEL